MNRRDELFMSLEKSEHVPMYKPVRGEFRQPERYAKPQRSTANTSRLVTTKTSTSGVECPKCGDRARALRTGHDDEGRVIRQRRCGKGHEFATLEIPVPYSFHRMLETKPPRLSATGKRVYRPRRPIIAEVAVKRRRLDRLNSA
jgi:hypothetical protein